ncbi:hypothetical protein D3C81_1441260 [compost metagenome]
MCESRKCLFVANVCLQVIDPYPLAGKPVDVALEVLYRYLIKLHACHFQIWSAPCDRQTNRATSGTQIENTRSRSQCSAGLQPLVNDFAVRTGDKHAATYHQRHFVKLHHANNMPERNSVTSFLNRQHKFFDRSTFIHPFDIAIYKTTQIFFQVPDARLLQHSPRLINSKILTISKTHDHSL